MVSMVSATSSSSRLLPPKERLREKALQYCQRLIEQCDRSEFLMEEGFFYLFCLRVNSDLLLTLSFRGTQEDRHRTAKSGELHEKPEVPTRNILRKNKDYFKDFWFREVQIEQQKSPSNRCPYCVCSDLFN